MSDLMLSQVQHMLSRVNDEVQKMGDITEERASTVLGAMDDLAANFLALQAVVEAMLKKYPIDASDAEAVLNRQLANVDGDAPKARQLLAEMMDASKS